MKGANEGKEKAKDMIKKKQILITTLKDNYDLIDASFGLWVIKLSL